MKYIAKFVRTEYKTAEVEFEAESEEAAKALINDENNDDIWHLADEKINTEGVSEGFPSIGFVELEEKSVHDERIKKEKEEQERWKNRHKVWADELDNLGIKEEDLPF